MNKKIIRYKVVMNNPIFAGTFYGSQGKLTSCRFPLQIGYIPGKFVSSNSKRFFKFPEYNGLISDTEVSPINGYHLTVFRTLEDAKNFWSGKYSNEEIWECEVRGKIEFLPQFRFFTGGEWPTGTEMWKEVKLIKKIC